MTRTLPLLLTLVIPLGCGGDGLQDPQGSQPHSNADATQPQTNGFETPQAAFGAFREATEQEDWRAAAKCLTAESQVAMATMITFPLAMMAAFDESKRDEINGLVGKHGLDLENADRDAPPGSQITDKVAYIADVMEWLSQNSDKSEEAEGMTPLVNGTLGEISISGDTARSVLTASGGDTDEIEFRKIGGRWFVHLGDFNQQSSGSDVSRGTVEFEGNSGTFGFGQDDPPPVPVTAVTVDQFNRSWQLSQNVADQPAGELLGDLAKQLGLKLQPAPDTTDALANPVSLSIEGKSRFEAIEQICRQIDVTPHYSPQALSIEAGPRQSPVVFAGPLLIRIDGLETNPKYATGRLTLQAFASGLPPSIVEALNETGTNTGVAIDDISNASGKSLWHQGAGGGAFFQDNGTVFDRQLILGLKNLLRKVETIASITGTVNVALPTQVTEFKFDPLTPGTEQTANDVTLKLKSANGGSVELEYKNADDDNIQVLAFDVDDKPMTEFASGGFGSGNQGSLSISYQGPPARLEARVITASEDIKYPFEFRDVPVPDHGNLPETLTPLEFQGDAPVTLKFARISGQDNFRKVVFDATNAGNKDIRRMSMQLGFEDGGGKVLKDSPSQYSGDVIVAGQSQEIEVSAFFMPEGTKTVRATVDRVEFADATEWEAE